MWSPHLPDPYRSVSTERRLTVVAVAPLSFEPKGWQLELRGHMRDGLSVLMPGPVHARVWDGTGRVLDVENALMYNVGTTHFAKHMAHGLVLERVRQPFLDPGVVQAQANYEYVLAQSPVASDTSDLTIEIDPPKPNLLAVWTAIRRALLNRGDLPDLTNRRLHLEVSGPVLSAGSVKGFLDGVVSGLHGSRDPATLAALGDLGVDDVLIHDVGERPGPLGWRQLLRTTGTGRRSWNPADDLLDLITFIPAMTQSFMVKLITTG